LKKEKREWIATNKTLRSECEDLRNRAEDAEEHSQGVVKELKGLQGQLLTANGRCAEMEEELRKLQSKLTEKEQQLQEERTSKGELEKKLKAAAASLTQVTIELEELRALLKSLQDENKALQDEIVELKETIAQLQTTSVLPELQAVKQENVELKNQLDDTAEALEELTLVKGDRMVVWEYENLDKSGMWLMYDSDISDKIEMACEGRAPKICMQVVHKRKEHPALIHPMNRLHINMDNGMNLKMRRRKIVKKFETIAHNDSLQPKSPKSARGGKHA